MRVRIQIILALVFSLFLVACGPAGISNIIMLDTPAHHSANGFKLLDSGKIESAQREFFRARELDPTFSSAYIGLALVYGFQGNFKEALKTMGIAEQYQKGTSQEVSTHVGYMRLYLMGREKIRKDWLILIDWLILVENEYKSATQIDPDQPAPYFYMGLAYKMSFKFQKAARSFSRVVEIGGDYSKTARNELMIIQQIERTKTAGGNKT